MQEPLGGLYATLLNSIDLSFFNLDSSILESSIVLLSMVVACGARSLAGSVIEPFLLLTVPRVLALADIATTITAVISQLIHGVFLIAFVLFRPVGPAGEKL